LLRDKTSPAEYILKNEINDRTDFTFFDHTATYCEVKNALDKCIELKIKEICIPPCFVRWAKKYVCDRLKICMMINIPYGNETVNAKVVQIREGLKNGADEFEAAINMNELKSGNVDYVFGELRQLKRACRGRLLKCVFDPSVLTKAELQTFCKNAVYSKCDYLTIGYPFGKTASESDIDIIKNYCGKKIRYKIFSKVPDEEEIEKILSKAIDRAGILSLPLTDNL